MMGLLSDVASELFKHLLQKPIASLANHASYTLRPGRHVRAMETAVKMLKEKKADAQNHIEAADRAGKEVTNEVKGWLERVTALEDKAGSVTNDYGNRGCILLGASSLNCFSNHSIGARAAKVKVGVEQELKRRSDFSEIVTDKPPPPVQPVPVTTLPEVSRYEIERKLGVALDFLRDGGEGSLGIWGMGGVGKTTLLLHINNALAKDPSSFGIDEAVLVTASRDCTIGKLQGLIAEKLKLASQLGENIYNHLSSRNFVLLLDDLWAPLDLLEVGVPPLGMVDGFKRKLILTTRSRQVCHVMEVRRTVRVECLNREAARLLFREKVGGEAINADPLIPMLANGVADECGGLPKALICIARAMAGKRRVSLWERAIRDLKASKPSEIVVQGMEEDPLPLLKVSYDYLPNARVRECLLHCALWPEDCKIGKQDLIECWMGHGLLGEFDNVGDAYEEGDEMIDILEKASLLEYCEDKLTISDEDGVSLHDLIRDMALWIARDCGANEKKWLVLDEPPKDEKSWTEARKMSIMFNHGMAALPSNIMCSGSNLTTLILRSCHFSHHDLGILQHLHSLAYLDLFNNPYIKNFPMEICLLAKLEFLDLSSTGIKRLPDELQNLKNLKCLLLAQTKIMEVCRQVLSGLERLEVLEVTRSYRSPPHTIHSNTIIDGLVGLKGRLKGLGITAYSMSDVSKLSQMSHATSTRTLYIWIQSADQTPTTLCLMPPGSSWSKLIDLFIYGWRIPRTEELVMEGEHLSSLKRVEIVGFKGLKDIIWKRVEQTSVIPNIRRVHISGCHQLKHVGWIANLPLLEILHLNSCLGLKQVVPPGGGEVEAKTTELGGGGEHKVQYAFPAALKHLRLECLPLETICNHPANFPSLETLYVVHCQGLKKLPFHSPASCGKLKEITCPKEWWENLELDDGMRTALQPSAVLF